MLSRLFPIIAVTCLAGCAGDNKWASDADVARATYAAGPPPSITLITSINGRSGTGAHSAILINGSQRVLFDPAGSWELTDGQAPERKDLHYGMNPGVLQSYYDFQAASIFYVISQTKEVSLAVADQAIAKAVSMGSTAPTFCAHTTSGLLQATPGFDKLGVTLFPEALAKSFAKLPGVQNKIIQGPDGGKELGDKNRMVNLGAAAVTN